MIESNACAPYSFRRHASGSQKLAAIPGSCSPGYFIAFKRAPSTERRRRFAVVCRLGGQTIIPSCRERKSNTKSEDAVNDGMLP